MSIFCLTNKTGEDVKPDWSNFTFPDGVAIDLINSSSYNETKYNIGLDIEDIVGIHGGNIFNEIKALIIGGSWKLGDGYREYYYTEALYLLSTGTMQGFQLTGEGKTIVSHDLCQPTTWHQNATHVTDEVLRQVDGNYKTAYPNLICLKRGFLYQEDNTPFQTEFNLKINGIAITDMTKFSIEPITGTVTFEDGFIAAPDTDIITCSYDYGLSSIFDAFTDDDHMWRIIKTEIQLDSSIVITDSIIMEVVIDHPLAGADYVASRWIYKSVRDFISGSNLGFAVPSFGGNKEDAGLVGSIIILPFDYTNPLELPVGMNARLRMRTENDTAPIGNFGTITFYMDKIKL